MKPDLLSLYTLMLKSRLFELAIAKLWDDGLISGEMHLGTGEEAIIAGVTDHLREGDAMALDHRGTAALLMRGVDPRLILLELLGHPKGLCKGMGGHMHLFSKPHLAASSGIVGASGPAGIGFALAAQYLNPGSIAVSFFGDGSVNQGMMMESLNLASVWKLPILFICKDDNWAITTKSDSQTGGTLQERVQSFGIPVIQVNGTDITDVWENIKPAIQNAREGKGPSFILANCVHLEGHFLGFQLLKIVRKPLKEIPELASPLTASILKPGGAEFKNRLSGLKNILSAVTSTLQDPRQHHKNDPIPLLRKQLKDIKNLTDIETRIESEIKQIVKDALLEVPA